MSRAKTTNFQVIVSIKVGVIFDQKLMILPQVIQKKLSILSIMFL
jgi:hypothetical protein